MLTDIVFNIIGAVLQLMVWALILSAVVSMLLAFNVLDRRNNFVWSMADFLYRVTDPVLRPIRRYMPNMGNLDLSPLVALLAIQLVIMPIVAELHVGLRTGIWPPLF